MICFICPELANSDFKCDACEKLACSQGHFRIHADSRCDVPFTIRDAGPEMGGRHFIANRDIKPLQTILIDKPRLISSNYG